MTAAGYDARQDTDRPGFVGKLPSHGDFVSRRLDAALRSGWEAWLDAGVERSRAMLGDAWLGTYLSSPIWCFSLSDGCCGDRACAGVLMPSVDRVGRYYPLSIIALVEGGCSAVEVALGARGWYAQMESIALSSLADGFDFERFDTSVAGAVLPPRESLAAEPGATVNMPTADLALRLSELLGANRVPYSLWWTSAADASYRVFQRLPPADAFAGLLGSVS